MAWPLLSVPASRAPRRRATSSPATRSGDWFDYVENPGGTWLGIADAIGKGAAAAAPGAIALGSQITASWHGGGAHVHGRSHPRPPGRAHRARLRWRHRTGRPRRHAHRHGGSPACGGDVAPTSAAETVKAIEDAVRHASPEPLEDDATLIVLAPVDTPAP